jgi:hypothetical protein
MLGWKPLFGQVLCDEQAQPEVKRARTGGLTTATTTAEDLDEALSHDSRAAVERHGLFLTAPNLSERVLGRRARAPTARMPGLGMYLHDFSRFRSHCPMSYSYLRG